MASCPRLEQLRAEARSWTDQHPGVGPASNACDSPDCKVFFGQFLAQIFQCNDCPLIKLQQQQEQQAEHDRQDRANFLARIESVIAQRKNEIARNKKRKKKRPNKR